MLESSIRDYVKKKPDQSRDASAWKRRKSQLLEVLKCSKGYVKRDKLFMNYG